MLPSSGCAAQYFRFLLVRRRPDSYNLHLPAVTVAYPYFQHWRSYPSIARSMPKMLCVRCIEAKKSVRPIQQVLLHDFRLPQVCTL